MALLLALSFLLVGRIAQASDMFTRAQTGADAAALGTLSPLRDKALELLLDPVYPKDPKGTGYWLVGDPEVSAAKFAKENTTELVGKVHLSGAMGETAKVTVRTKECQLKRDEELTAQDRDDLRKRKNLCTDNQGKEGIGRYGTATAIARMTVPDCVFKYRPYIPAPVPGGGSPPLPGDPGGQLESVTCGGVQAYPKVPGNFRKLQAQFKIRLVDKESPIDYTGEPANGIAGGGGVVVDHCAKDGSKPPEDLSFGAAVVAWALCWRGTPYSWGGGNYSGPTLGICCSPGGHDARGTLGFDCSGLTLYAVFQASRGRIALGHYTGNQVNDPRGRPVPVNQLQAGDIIFFGSMPTHHVAIYYGDGKMVEAPQTGDVVKISPLRNVSYARRFG
ncbi:C40 family peptidase [Actinomadura hibisca]|uniref:C40 family peptidase n=1 Tax=Actinomadura hibisca TaxID=68565 RepID=UPI001C3F409B|nr:C40 family peptidase [Actinomadura hibisca]